MMQTVTVDILDERAYRLLEGLEALDVIRVHPMNESPKGTGLSKLRGSIQLSKSVEKIDQELRELRNEWERDFF